MSKKPYLFPENPEPGSIFKDRVDMTYIQFIDKQIAYHEQCVRAAKKPHIKKRHKRRIKYFLNKRKKAQMLDLIGGTHARL
ncbi:MAG: hypothetical protein ACRBB6_04375 [Neptuniibacter sp.]